jgi:hypothetical protein
LSNAIRKSGIKSFPFLEQRTLVRTLDDPGPYKAKSRLGKKKTCSVFIHIPPRYFGIC